MATRIDIEYDRKFISSEVQDIIARAATSTHVLSQLGADYQSLPGLVKTTYEAETAALEADLSALNGLIDQIRPLLIAIDTKAAPLAEKNKKLLHTLRGLLQTGAQAVLLDQITGATPQSSPPTPPTPPA